MNQFVPILTAISKNYHKNLSEDTRGEMFEKILSSISFHAFPKKILPEQSVMIKNYAQKNIGIVDNQIFVDIY